ncbi:hypothetical protein BZA77DRAFT_303076 [Pyronema omphalodes]|nr:hypothetical protein BZA77DRAFT_303076 [Pyronema omphalodes]
MKYCSFCTIYNIMELGWGSVLDMIMMVMVMDRGFCLDSWIGILYCKAMDGGSFFLRELGIEMDRWIWHNTGSTHCFFFCYLFFFSLLLLQIIP